MDRKTRYVRAATRRVLSNRTLFRGRSKADGRVTLLTVNYNSREDVSRLVRSFRRFVSPAWPVVVVENGGPPRAISGASVVGLGFNLHHGLGLDFGLRFVSTEYALIIDPDSIIVGDLWSEMRWRVDAYGAASIDIGGPGYHPICMAFRTELWKSNRFSMQEDWSRGYDVGGHVTEQLGGLVEDAVLPRTRSAGPPIRSSRPGKRHFVGEVYAEVFSNTLGGSRAMAGSEAFGPEEGSFKFLVGYHARWRRWADAYIDGSASLDDFPAE
jgi:hypothetical protein